MQMNEVRYSDVTPIDSYGPDFFRVAGQVIHGAALIHAEGAASWGGFDDTEMLFSLIGKMDILLIGTGPQMTLIPASLRSTLEEAGVGVETMQTATACRTFNVLLSEGRRVAAALLPAV